MKVEIGVKIQHLDEKMEKIEILNWIFIPLTKLIFQNHIWKALFMGLKMNFYEDFLEKIES